MYDAGYGISLGASGISPAPTNCFIINNTFIGCTTGLEMYEPTYCNITNNNFTSNAFGIYIGADNTDNNLIYNNIFDSNTNTINDDSNSELNVYNIEKTLGTNIIGGPYLGGNYYSDNIGAYNGSGFSVPYAIPGTSIFDYLPLMNASENIWQQISKWNGSIFNTSIWNSIKLWNGTVWNYSGIEWSTISRWNGTVYNGTAYNGGEGESFPRRINYLPYLLFLLLPFYLLMKRRRRR
jgi:parallel beta-helix repeat protein